MPLMESASPLDTFTTSTDPVRQNAIAEAYAPIIRTLLLPACAYYFLITGKHWQFEAGSDLAVLAGLSAATALAFYYLRQHKLIEKTLTFRGLERIGLLINALIYLNAVSYMAIHFEQSKLVYFALMALVFSTTCVSFRTMLLSVTAPLATLYWFASGLSDDLLTQYASIGIATAVGSLAMAALLRKAILQQIDARLLADEMAEKAQRLADTDMLTGIPNRRAIFDRIDYLVRQRRPFWMGIFDLDGFKAINDVYGHVIGDNLLCAVVDRAAGLDLEGATFGRIGGDEFIVIFSGNLSEEKVGQLGKHVIEEIGRPYRVDLLQLSVGASAGFSHFPSMGASGAQLYEKADFALYKAKTHLRGQCVLFDTAEDEEMKRAIQIERELREADLEKELFLLYQPQYSPAQQRVVGFEALARWQSPKLGLVRPDLFIRAAERSGHIRRVTDILFRKGLATLATWPRDISLSFNLSGQDISNQAFVLSLLAQIMESGISPDRLEFEITETAVMSDLENSRTLLEQLRASGCKIALDDFGSGYSSFEYLDQLPLDKVKIDKSFVRKVSHSVTSREIIAGVIGLCRKLDLRCVLEGVETEAEMDMLARLEPDLIQGYLFGRPMSPEDALRRIMDQDGTPVRHAPAPRSA